jgi:hypothetical protein
MELKIWHLLVAKKSAACYYIISYLRFMERYILSIAVNDQVFVYLLSWCDGAVSGTVANKAYNILILKCRMLKSGKEVGEK